MNICSPIAQFVLFHLLMFKIQNNDLKIILIPCNKTKYLNIVCDKTFIILERQVFLKISKDSDSIMTIRPPVEHGIDSLIKCALKCSQDLFLCQAVIFTQDTGECEIISDDPVDADLLPVYDKQYIVHECLV